MAEDENEIGAGALDVTEEGKGRGVWKWPDPREQGRQRRNRCGYLDGGQHHGVCAHGSCKPKVAKLNHPTFPYEDVLRLHVSVHDPMVVKIPGVGFRIRDRVRVTSQWFGICLVHCNVACLCLCKNTQTTSTDNFKQSNKPTGVARSKYSILLKWKADVNTHTHTLREREREREREKERAVPQRIHQLPCDRSNLRQCQRSIILQHGVHARERKKKQYEVECSDPRQCQRSIILPTHAGNR
jgi:hypothetical protein